ncbi:hypothetical protein HK096_003604 [Nowakowskiella sp. JEL0078]|nr:hypothetical protein HK096_003604 [Nowakowskiella sp. JEL0078]
MQPSATYLKQSVCQNLQRSPLLTVSTSTPLPLFSDFSRKQYSTALHLSTPPLFPQVKAIDYANNFPPTPLPPTSFSINVASSSSNYLPVVVSSSNCCLNVMATEGYGVSEQKNSHGKQGRPPSNKQVASLAEAVSQWDDKQVAILLDCYA